MLFTSATWRSGDGGEELLLPDAASRCWYRVEPKADTLLVFRRSMGMRWS